MVTGFDIWGHDAGLRRHWKGRIIAFIIDAAIAFIPTSLALYMLDVTDIFTVGLVNTVIFYLSSSVVESFTGASLGKRLLGFRVYPVKGESIAGKACVRNITRAFWFILPPLDFAIGLAMRGDPRQKLLDRVAGTKVVHLEEKERHEAAIRSAPEPVKEFKEPESQTDQEVCEDCAGPIILLPGGKFQCEKCGLIQ
ncbi:MAG: RDD family protein [Thermoplasmata archaeon]|nr:RDD family protein [Thermoplasmata archaeon]